MPNLRSIATQSTSRRCTHPRLRVNRSWSEIKAIGSQRAQKWAGIELLIIVKMEGINTIHNTSQSMVVSVGSIIQFKLIRIERK